MGGIDKLLADALTKKIKQNIDGKELRKIERGFFLETGMSIKMAMTDFEKLDTYLKNIKINHRQIEKDCLNEICQTKRSQDKVILKVLDEGLKRKIIECFTDVEMKEIMVMTFKKSFTIPAIIKKTKIPRTSLYRKIEELTRKGMIVEREKTLSKSKRIPKLKCIFEEINIKIKPDTFLVTCHISKQDFENSSIMKILNAC